MRTALVYVAVMTLVASCSNAPEDLFLPSHGGGFVTLRGSMTVGCPAGSWVGADSGGPDPRSLSAA